jgi:hypothetical protein
MSRDYSMHVMVNMLEPKGPMERFVLRRFLLQNRVSFIGLYARD